MIIMLFVKRGGGVPDIGNWRTAIFYQLSYFLTPARQVW